MTGALAKSILTALVAGILSVDRNAFGHFQHFAADLKRPCLILCAEQLVYPFGAFGVELMFEYGKQM